jgi:hypothetical protein
MSRTLWHIHLQGAIIGPLPTETIELMLRQSRLQFADYIWASPMKEWQRIGEVPEFAALLPAFPKVQPPIEEKDKQVVHSSTNVIATPEAKTEEVWLKVRRFNRVKAEQSKAALTGYGTYRVVDVSEGGIFIDALDTIPVGTPVRAILNLHPGDQRIEVNGIVVRHGVVEGIRGFAIEFRKADPSNKRILHEYVEGRLQIAMNAPLVGTT